LSEILIESLEIPKRNITYKVYEEIKKNSSKIKTIEDIKDYHYFYPIPDINYGRPHLEDLVCKHYNCNKKFLDIFALKNHLEQHNAYTYGAHLYHEMAVSKYNLTPNNINQNKMTKCPSYVCKESHKTFTPEELIEHFKILGIEPFWKVGDVIKPPQITNSDKFDIYQVKVYKENNCIICFDSDKECIIYPCLHYICCLECSTLIDKCPKCLIKFDYVIPY